MLIELLTSVYTVKIHRNSCARVLFYRHHLLAIFRWKLAQATCVRYGRFYTVGVVASVCNCVCALISHTNCFLCILQRDLFHLEENCIRGLYGFLSRSIGKLCNINTHTFHYIAILWI